MKNHHKNVCCREDQEFKCAQCGKKFNQSSNLTRHIKIVHNRETPYKCEFCSKRFSTKQNLQFHIHGVHEDARPHVCEDCGITYKYAQQLDHHRIKEHTHQWYWNCDVCDANKIEMGFLLPCQLKRHMLAEHPQEYKKQIEEEKPAVCPKCQKRFRSEDEVDIHLRKIHKVDDEAFRKTTLPTSLSLSAAAQQPLHVSTVPEEEEKEANREEHSPADDSRLGAKEGKDNSGYKCTKGKQHRLQACRKCEGCLRANCGECVYCQDMPRFGGVGVIKQKCKTRVCVNPVRKMCDACVWFKLDD